MKYTRWSGGTYDLNAVAQLHEAGYPSLLATVLASRGMTMDEAHAFLSHPQDSLHDAMLMRDMDKAVRRIKQALDNK